MIKKKYNKTTEKLMKFFLCIYIRRCDFFRVLSQNLCSTNFPLGKIYIKDFQNYYITILLNPKIGFFFLLELDCFSYVLIIWIKLIYKKHICFLNKNKFIIYENDKNINSIFIKINKLDKLFFLRHQYNKTNNFIFETNRICYKKKNNLRMNRLIIFIFDLEIITDYIWL